MDDFTRAYMEAALWSSVDDEGEPLDVGRDYSDIAPETRERMERDCREFQAANLDALACACAAAEWLAEEQRYSKPDYDMAQAGHDFWLTRNGHGAGFWDRGLGICGEALTRASEKAGAFTLYVGDDGLIYGMEG